MDWENAVVLLKFALMLYLCLAPNIISPPHWLPQIFFPFCRRGFVFGLWSACASVGNILGAFLASCVLKYGYEVGIAVWLLARTACLIRLCETSFLSCL